MTVSDDLVDECRAELEQRLGPDVARQIEQLAIEERECVRAEAAARAEPEPDLEVTHPLAGRWVYGDDPEGLEWVAGIGIPTSWTKEETEAREAAAAAYGPRALVAQLVAIPGHPHVYRGRVERVRTCLGCSGVATSRRLERFCESCIVSLPPEQIVELALADDRERRERLGFLRIPVEEVQVPPPVAGAEWLEVAADDAPLVAGGQGRTTAEVEDDARGGMAVVVWAIGLWLVAAAAIAVGEWLGLLEVTGG